MYERKGPSWQEILSAGMAFLLLAAAYLRMTPQRWFHAIAPDPGDPLLNLAFLRWGADRVAHGFADFWNPTFFHPLRGVLALSDHLAGPAVVAAGLAALGLPPAAVYNTLLLVAFGGSALTCFLVLRWSGISRCGAALGALAWSFSCFRWTALSHLQVLLALWVPMTLWMFDRLLSAPSPRRVALFLMAYAAQLSGGSYLAYMIHLPLAVQLAVRLRHGWRVFLRTRNWIWLAGAAAICGGLIAVFFGPYLVLGKRFGLSPGLGELADSMVTLRSYVSIGARTLYADSVPGSLRGQPQLWFGFIPTFLTGFGLYSWFAQRRMPSSRHFGSDLALFVLLLSAALLSLAIADFRLLVGGLATSADLLWARRAFLAASAVLLLSYVLFLSVRRRWSRAQPLDDREIWWRGLLLGGLASAVVSHVAPFVLLRRILPGLEAIRVPGRFFVFTSLALAAIAGLGFDRLRSKLAERWPRVTRPVLALVIALAVSEAVPRAKFNRWIEVPAPEAAPGVYRWLATHPEVAAVVELPMLETWREAERMYFWTVHWRPLLNGYSAYLPQSYLELRQGLLDFPGPQAAEQLSRIGVTHLVIHLDQLAKRDQRAWKSWQAALDRSPNPWLEKIHEEAWAMIYRIVIPPTRSP